MMGENLDVNAIWRNQGIIERNRHLLSSGEMSDCTFLVGTKNYEKQKFSCHKFVLGSASGVFSTMFYGSLVETDVKVTDVRPEHFKQMLEYIYTDNVILNDVNTTLGIWSAAHKYMIEPLSKKCETFICGNLSVLNACPLLHYAILFASSKLYRLTNKIITDRTNAVLTSQNFTGIKLTILKHIVTHDVLNIRSECELFKACLRWAEAKLKDGSKIRFHMNPLLGHIRFRCFTTQEFVDTVCRIELLTLAEQKDILYCIATRSGVMPPRFSSSNVARKRFGNEVWITISPHYPRYSGIVECEKDENKITFYTNFDVRFVCVNIGEPIPNKKYKIVIKHGEDKFLVDTDEENETLWLKEPQILCAKKQYTLELEFQGQTAPIAFPFSKKEFHSERFGIILTVVQGKYSPFSSILLQRENPTNLHNNEYYDIT